ncbi:hypothetical protein MMC31_001013 [Peltigera leucophlebia]|nr:hypothetical protein [Peltigera leucophlebia]
MEAYQGDLGEDSPRGFWGGSGYQSKGRREEKMPACNDESRRDGEWTTVGMQSWKMHSQDGVLGVRLTGQGSRILAGEGKPFPHPNQPRRQARAKIGSAAPSFPPRTAVDEDSNENDSDENDTDENDLDEND